MSFERLVPVLTYRDIPAAHDFLVRQREYGARDPEGHRWWIATPIAAPPAK